MFTVIMSALMSINVTLVQAGDDIYDVGERFRGEIAGDSFFHNQQLLYS